MQIQVVLFQFLEDPIGDGDDLRFGFAHGCGTLAWAAPRLGLALSIWGGEGRSAEFDGMLRHLWVDTLVLDPAHLPLLVHRFVKVGAR